MAVAVIQVEGVYLNVVRRTGMRTPGEQLPRWSIVRIEFIVEGLATVLIREEEIRCTLLAPLSKGRAVVGVLMSNGGDIREVAVPLDA